MHNVGMGDAMVTCKDAMPASERAICADRKVEGICMVTRRKVCRMGGMGYKYKDVTLVPTNKM